MMASSSSSSSSSSLALIWLYHVFLSFRGEDVREGFLSHVLKEFKSKGIIVFIDNEIKRGESVGPMLVKAIRHSRIAVVLLSRRYASSSWCLDELVEIMKCREEFGQKVLTIFYKVDPSDVRKQIGDFGKAFDETCVGKTEEVKQSWRQALKDVAGIAGYHSSNCGNEADLINKVASDVMAVLGFTPSKDFDDFVGIETRIAEIKSKLILQSEQVKVIGIFGPGGIGKTTTARILYNQLSAGFPFNTFLENIRGSYEQPCGNDYQLKLCLQKNLLCKIFNKEDVEVCHLGRAQEMLNDKKVLVVLDEVDNWWQLEEMAKKRGWVGPGSIIIITTEDRKLLKALGLGSDHIYKVKYPTEDESLQIFCHYAFGQKSPDDGFEWLAWEVSRLAGHLPLGLRVMGSYVRGMSRDEWIQALPWLRLLQQMGREIVKKQLMENPGKPHFLKDTNEISDALDEDSVTGNVLGIRLRTCKTIQISKSAFQGMNSLQFLYFLSYTLCIPDGLYCLPSRLVLLHWDVCPLRVWPSKFSGKFLVEITMQYSEFEMLWEGIKPLPCLKMLNLSFSKKLKKVPDLSEAPSLEELCLYDCKSLLELTSSIGNATKLYRLDIRGCTKIKDFPNVPDSILELVLCKTGIKEVPPWIKNLSLRKLFMHGCKKLKTISPNISKLENLEFLALSNYAYLPFNNHCNVKHAENHLEDVCDDTFEAIIEWGPDFKRSWRLQSNLDVDYILPICLPEQAVTSPISLRLCSGIKTIPDCIRRLSRLIKLNIKECRELVALPPLQDSLLSLDAQGCKSLKRIDSSCYQNPEICLNFANCFNLGQKARKLIQTSACKYAVLPGEEVPAHFTHRAGSGSLTINLTPGTLTSSFRFKACLLLSKVYNHHGDTSGDDDEEGENSLTGMSYSVRGNQNGLTVRNGSNQLHMPALSGYEEHLYIFEDSFSPNQDCRDAEETIFSELTFVFRVDDKTCKVKGCGVRLLEAKNESAGGEDEEKETDDDDDDDDDDEDDDDEDDDDECGDDGEGGEDDDNDDYYVDDDNASGDGGEEDDDEGDEGGGDDDDDHGEDDEGNKEANNETDGEESRCDEDGDTRSRKRMRLGFVQE